MKKFDSYINWLNEKFEEDSDPIHDMNIGMIHELKHWMETKGHKFRDKDDALEICASYGETEFVKYLLNVGANANTMFNIALKSASDYGYTEIVKLLLYAGADVHADNDYSLRWASSGGHVDVVKLLLDADADVSAKNYEALIWAVKFKHNDVVKVLKDHIAKEKKIKESLNEKFTEDSDPIHDMGIGIEKTMDDFFESKLFPLYFKDNASRLRSSITYNKPDFVKYLVNKVPQSRLSEFLNGAINATSINLEIIKIFVEAGAGLNGQTVSPIYLACKRGREDVVNYLIDKGAVPTHGSFGVAAAKGHIDILKLLIKRSKKVNISTLQSALTAACINSQVNIAEFLIKEGVPLDNYIKDSKIKEWKKKHQKVRIIKLLEKYKLI